MEIEVGAIIVANGYNVFDPSRIPEYRYREMPNVMTAMEFERFLSASGPTGGHMERPSDRAVQAEIHGLEKQAQKSRKAMARFEEKQGEDSEAFYEDFKKGLWGDAPRKKWAQKYGQHLASVKPLEELKKQAESFTMAKKLAFIQCVGSRDFRFYPFCSGFCCMHSIKEAIIANEHDRETTSVIFGMDIRAVGKGFEEYKVRGGNQSRISYRRGRIAEITEGQ